MHNLNIKNLKLTIKNLKELRKQDHKDHKKLDMRSWFQISNMGSDYPEMIEEDTILEVEIMLEEFGRTEQSCSTSACLAGWIQTWGATSWQDKSMMADEFASNWLGLGAYVSETLFLNPFTYGKSDLSEVTIDDLIPVLENLLETGSVGDGIYPHSLDY